MLHERHLFDPRNLSSLCISPLHNKNKKRHSMLPYPAMPVDTHMRAAFAKGYYFLPSRSACLHLYEDRHREVESHVYPLLTGRGTTETGTSRVAVYRGTGQWPVMPHHHARHRPVQVGSRQQHSCGTKEAKH